MVTVFTSKRIIEMAEKGPLRYIWNSDVEFPPADAPRQGLRVVGGDAPAGAHAPLHDLYFHHVHNVYETEAAVYAEVQRLRDADCAPGPAASDATERLPADLAAQLTAVMQPGERLAWCYRPAATQVAVFWVPLLVLLLSNLPWMLWVGNPSMQVPHPQGCAQGLAYGTGCGGWQSGKLA